MNTNPIVTTWKEFVFSGITETPHGPAEPMVTLDLSASSFRAILLKNSNKQGKIQEAKAAGVTVLEFIATVGVKETTENLVLIGKDSSPETTL
jgi:ABC-type methionine transport system permease subunit